MVSTIRKSVAIRLCACAARNRFQLRAPRLPAGGTLARISTARMLVAATPWLCGAFIVSGCLQLTSVLVNQPSKSPTAGHATPTDRLPPLRWLQSARLVRSLLVVVGHVLNEHRAEMALADDQHPVPALAASAAHPPLRMRIGSRSQQR